MTTANLRILTRTDYEHHNPVHHPIAVPQEAQKPYRVSNRLDLFAAQQPLISEAIISIAESVRNVATLLEMLVATKMPSLSGVGTDWHGVDKQQGTVAAENKAVGYGLPCSKCHAYYRADLAKCPICQSQERISPTTTPALAATSTNAPL